MKKTISALLAATVVTIGWATAPAGATPAPANHGQFVSSGGGTIQRSLPHPRRCLVPASAHNHRHCVIHVPYTGR